MHAVPVTLAGVEARDQLKEARRLLVQRRARLRGRSRRGREIDDPLYLLVRAFPSAADDLGLRRLLARGGASWGGACPSH